MTFKNQAGEFKDQLNSTFIRGVLSSRIAILVEENRTWRVMCLVDGQYKGFTTEF